ncbi:L-alanine exporter AlaE [Candidatus Woesearchaeota archaeon]|nr:L-alanine exporter AlaE [Candidatus Woesearchaeota archaeon]
MEWNGMEWKQAAQARLAAAIGNMITGGPYGEYSNWVVNKFQVTDESHHFKKYAVDVLTFATGQAPIYALYLALPIVVPEVYEGIRQLDGQQIRDAPQQVNWEAVRTGVISLTLIAPILATPQRITYNVVRQWSGVKGIYQKEETNKP